MDRRSFLGAAALGAGRVFAPTSLRAAEPSPAAGTLLVLGGTNFVGPAVVEEALRRGHEVTLFNRGLTRPYLFPDVERLHGSRSADGGDLSALAGPRRWDAVVDVWPEERALVDHTAQLLAERADYYFYVSSIAVYADYSRPGTTEQASVRGGPPGSYGAEKAGAEAAVAERFEGRYGVARCPAIVGPLDPGSSYHFWLRRLATRDVVLCPGTGDDPIQTVDVRDVAGWVLDCVERRTVGTHNLTGPWPPRTMGDFLRACRAGIDSRARLEWVDADFLRRDQGLRSFSDLPMWAPLDEDEGFYQIDGSRALAAGARYRPVEETAAAAWRWYRSHFFKDTTFPLHGAGISAEREDEVLAAWRTRG